MHVPGVRAISWDQQPVVSDLSQHSQVSFLSRPEQEKMSTRSVDTLMEPLRFVTMEPRYHVVLPFLCFLVPAGLSDSSERLQYLQ